MPASAEDIRLGAMQEWARLSREPPVPWQSDLIEEFRDPLGHRRGAACGLPWHWMVHRSCSSDAETEWQDSLRMAAQENLGLKAIQKGT